jgi:hypothetical protein
MGYIGAAFSLQVLWFITEALSCDFATDTLLHSHIQTANWARDGTSERRFTWLSY